MRAKQLAQSNLMGWTLVIASWVLPWSAARVALLLAAAGVFIAREGVERRRAAIRCQHAENLTSREIRQMQSALSLKLVASEEEFWQRPDGTVNHAKKGRIEEATRLVQPFVTSETMVLDVGCGDGVLTRRLTARAGWVAGVDISRPLLEVMLRWVARRHVAAVEADAEQLPFQKSSFDLIVLTETLEHLVDPPRGLAEAARVAKQDGTVLITVPNANRLTLNPITMARQLVATYCRHAYRHANEAIYHSGARMFFIHNAFRPLDLRLMCASLSLQALASGTFHSTFLDGVRGRWPVWAARIDASMRRLPILGQFGRYSFVIARPATGAQPGGSEPI